VQAVILAGGEGTRLRPLTLACAKPVVPLLNRPFLAYQLALLRQHGITDVILACSYRVDDVRNALGDGAALGVRLRYVIEREPLGTGGGIRNAADLTAGTVVVLNGDVLTDADISSMRRFHEARGARTTIYLMPVEDPRPFGLVEIEDDGRIRAFREKPTSADEITTNTINAGIYMIDVALLDRIPRQRMVSMEREIFPALIADGIPAYGWVPDAYWRDIGSPAAYRAAQIDLLDGRVRTTLRPAGTETDGMWLGPGAQRAADAQVRGPAVIGANVVLERGAVVDAHSVIGDGVIIGAGARVEGAILWHGVQVGPGAILHGCVVGAEARIGPHARVGARTVLAAGAEVPERRVLD
jgi:NDP-sugar pyrophosphorylase family protein